jgi:ribonuclease HII
MIVCGVDEVGYGCIFGPITCAAVVILDREKLIQNIPKHCVLRDSKKMTERQLQQTSKYLKENVLYGVASIPHTFINEHGLSKARIEGFHQAIAQVEAVSTDRKVEKIIVDGNFFKPYKDIPYETIVKGDATVLEIMCASIIAKETRDSLIYKWVDENPELQNLFKIRNNVGYATKFHMDGVLAYGPREGHRTYYDFFKTIPKSSPFGKSSK